MLEAQKLTYQSYFSQSAEFTREQVAQNPPSYLSVAEMFPTVISLDGSLGGGSSAKAIHNFTSVYYDRAAMDRLEANFSFSDSLNRQKRSYFDSIGRPDLYYAG